MSIPPSVYKTPSTSKSPSTNRSSSPFAEAGEAVSPTRVYPVALRVRLPSLVISVSYTHLDVYKRQPLRTTDTSEFPSSDFIVFERIPF